MRHSDVRVTTGVYGHLIVEDLRAAVEMNAQLRALTPGPENATPNGANEKFAAFLLHSAENGDSKGAGRAAEGPKISRESTEWAQQVSNLRPLPCEGSALPLSYAPEKLAQVAIRQIGSQWPGDGR